MHVPIRNISARPAPERSRSRRERRRVAARQPVLHVVAPGLEVASAVPRSRETVTAFLRRTGWAWRDSKYGWQFRKGLPTVLEVNGQGVLRKHWRTTKIGANDNVRFVSYPLGGKSGIKQVIGLVALVALAAFAAPLAGMAAGALGLGGSALATGFIQAGIMIGGSLLISALTAPKPGATNDPNAKVDQIYSAQAQGNAARLGQPLPVWYGRQKAYPDFAASPWGEFEGNDQYLNVLLSTTMGRMSYEQLLIDDTPFWNPVDGVLPGFSSAQVAFYEPGETVTLFPVNVHSAAEVGSGLQVPGGTGSWDQPAEGPWIPAAPGPWLGGFIANPSGTHAQAIAIDFVFPAGCFRVNQDNGNTQTCRIGFEVQYRSVDDAGAPIGDWSVLWSDQRTYSSRSPIRDSIKINVGVGRYEVRLRRVGEALADKFGASEMVWAGLRTFLAGANAFADVSTVAIRIKASESTQGSFKFGVIGTRKINVWDGSAFVEQPTRNPIWAMLDMATNLRYGAGHALSKVDFNAIVNQASAADARDDRFDYIFTSAVAVPEALDKALTVTRAKHFWLGDTLSVVRDEWRDLPTMMLTDREIVRGSTSLSYTMLGEEDPDAVIIEYIDEATWRPAQVQYPPEVPGVGGFRAVNAETRRIDGICGRQHAYREAAFYYLQSIYRRRMVSIETEYEGKAITFGSVIRVQTELPLTYGQAGAVLDQDDGTLTLDPAPIWEVGAQHYIRLRRPNGKDFGPIKVVRGGADDIAVLDAADLAAVEAAQSIALSAVLTRADGAEYPSFDLGTAENHSRLAMVLGGQPNGNTCKLSLVVDDERVHATDIGSPPVLPAPQYPTNPKAPLIAGLNALFTQGVAEPKLAASWFPAPGAFFYRAEVSYDQGASWLQVYEGQDNKFSTFVTLAGLKLRVQAIGAIHGPFSEIELAVPTIEVMVETVTRESLKAALREIVFDIGNDATDELREIADLTSQIVADIAARTDINKTELRDVIAVRSGEAEAKIEEVKLVAAAVDLSLASYKMEVTATLGDGFSAVNTVSEAFGTVADGMTVMGGAHGVDIDVNGYVVGTKLVNGGPGKSVFAVAADKIQFAMPDMNGGEPVPFMTSGMRNGVAGWGMTGDWYLDGIVTARMMQVVELSAISANIGTATAGVIRSADGKFIIDLNNRFFEIWD